MSQITISQQKLIRESEFDIFTLVITLFDGTNRCMMLGTWYLWINQKLH